VNVTPTSRGYLEFKSNMVKFFIELLRSI